MTKKCICDLEAEVKRLRADLARARRNAAHFEQLFEDVEKARAWFSRELYAARAAVGEAWFTCGATLAEAIERKCRMLEGLNATRTPDDLTRWLAEDRDRVISIGVDARLGAATRRAIGLTPHQLGSAWFDEMSSRYVVKSEQIDVLRAIADALRAEEGGSDE